MPSTFKAANRFRRNLAAVAVFNLSLLFCAAANAQSPATIPPGPVDVPGVIRRGTPQDVARFVGTPSPIHSIQPMVNTPGPAAQMAQRPENIFDRVLENQATEQNQIPGLGSDGAVGNVDLPDLPQGAAVDSLIPLELQRLALPRKAAELSQLPVPSPQTEEKFDRFVAPAQDPENLLYIVRGRPKLLPLKVAPLRIQVGDERIANYQLISPQELQIFGLREGRTVLNLWFRENAAEDKLVLLSYIIQVVDEYQPGAQRQRIFDRLAEDINAAIPRSRVRLTLVGNRLVISGDVPDQFTADKILQIVAGAFNQRQGATPQENIRVVVGVDGNFEGAPQQLADLLNANNLRTQNTANIVNLMRIVGEQQIQLRVTLAEVNRSALRAIGADFQLDFSSGASFTSLLPEAVAPLTPGGAVTSNRGDLSLAVSAIRTLGLSRTLAEPNLVTLNGQTATFQSGTDVAARHDLV
ncbi:MAG: pilus assembly protein N-terminal domain-containing protein, partial [Pirellulales bacterium]|nr:pilus assembly protein N-terminal domain-containing protein [Pirellulales bacterium]